MKNNRFKLIFVVSIFFLGAACVATTPTANQTVPNVSSVKSNAEENKDHQHEHQAPHGGTLVVLGEELAHVELVLDRASGKLTAYLLDGEAENAVKIVQPEIEIEINRPFKNSIKLIAIENALTGEKQGATSEFAAATEQLKNISNFDAEIRRISIKGQQFNLVSFNFPKGNEND